MTTVGKVESGLKAARLAVLAMFFLNGAIFGTWVSRIPDVQIRLGLSEGALGLVLLGIAVGVITALTLAGGLIARYGSRTVTKVGAVGLCLLLPLLALMPGAIALWINLFAFGAAMSLMDVAMNAQGVEVEQRYERALMSSFHAAFSIGGFAGAVLSAGMAMLTVLPLYHFSLVSLLFLMVVVVIGRWLLADNGRSDVDAPVFQLPHRLLWPLGVVAFCTALGEGAMADWSAVYLTSVVGTAAGLAAVGFAAFSLTMTIGRLLGDKVATFVEPSRLVRSGGLLAALGLVVAIVYPQPVMVIVGFAAVGAGLSIIIPLTFSAAGNIPGLSSGVGIAGVATIGYAGFLAGPPLIGLLAEATSLQLSLLVIAILVGSLVFTGRALRIAR